LLWVCPFIHLRGCEIDHEKFSIDVGGREEVLGLSDCLTEESVIILHSCPVGAGKEGGNNVANLMGDVFPQVKIFSLTILGGVYKYIYDSNNRVIDVDYCTFPRAFKNRVYASLLKSSLK